MRTFAPVAVPSRRPAIPQASLFQRVFLVNAAVLLVAASVLAATPLTLSIPSTVQGAVVLGSAVAATLVVNLVLIRRAFAPLDDLRSAMRKFDPLTPESHIPVEARDREVAELSEAFSQMADRLADERRESAARAIAAQERERQRVAQELHDEVGQSLTAVLLSLDRASQSSGDEPGGVLELARETARDSLEDVRRIAQRLRPEALDDFGVSSALDALAERLSEQTGLEIERELDHAIDCTDPDCAVVVYRIAQESLTNVIRHAEASRIELSLKQSDDALTLRVSDNGRGFDGRLPDRWGGLRGMRERALLVDGRLSVESAPRAGTTVQLIVPRSE